MAERDGCCRGPGRQGRSNGHETGKSDEEPVRVGGHQNSTSLRYCGWEMATLEQRVQERWKTFEDKWSEKVVHPDNKEAVSCSAEFRIRGAVQQDEDDRWKKRMASEDKITMNANETLRSDVTKMSAKMVDEVVSLKNRHQGSAASTVSGFTGSGATHFRGLPSRTQRMGQLEKHSWDRHHNRGDQTTSE